MNRVVWRSTVEETGISEKEEEHYEEAREEGMTVETEGTKEEAAEILASELAMEGGG